MSDKTVNEHDFYSLIEKAIEPHSRNYTASKVISFRWEDDIDANKTNTGYFRYLLQPLGLTKAEEYAIPASDTVPGFAVSAKLMPIIREALISGQPMVVFIHYTGHAKEVNGDVHFTDDAEERSFSVEWAFFQYMDDIVFPSSVPVDVVFIFDSKWHTHLTTRHFCRSDRVVEVLATNPGPRRYSLTRDLVNEINIRKNRGEREIEFAELAESLRANISTGTTKNPPVHAARIGINSIRLSFPSPPAAAVQSQAGSPELQPEPFLYAVFVLMWRRALPMADNYQPLGLGWSCSRVRLV